MIRRPALLLSLLLAATPAAADEIGAALTAALEAWRAGDIATAKDEADYAASLLGQQKAEGLGAFLPAPFDGWTREDGDTQAAAAMMFGGGLTASASYTRGGETVEVQLLADSPMVAAMAGMLASPAMMATMGEVRRAGGQRYVVTPDGQVTALVQNRVLVQIDGSATVDDKAAYFEAIDLDGLAAF